MRPGISELGSAFGLALVVAGSFTLGLILEADRAHAASPVVWESGDHKVGLSLSTRFRLEGWDAHATDTDWLQALRTRVGLTYSWKEDFAAFIEFQDARIHQLGSRSSGAGALYWANSGMSEKVHHDRIRQLWVQFKPVSELSVRAGRQDIKLGTEVMYPEANWKYLKINRGSQRLVGTVGWTHAERSNDGVTAAYDMGAHYLYLFGAKPTTGVFDIDSAYAGQNDILYGGASWTAKRGTLLPETEVRVFGIGYRDDRDADDGAFAGATNEDIVVWNVGATLIGIYPCGAGNADLMLWGSFQWGDWQDLDHRAWAALLEAGYQFTEIAMKPWFRAGVNVASGDGSATDSDSEAFFNLLPTNHLYYGYADQFALSNLVNYFGQLRLTLTTKTGLELFLHHFTKFTHDDGRWFGTGAFNKNSFGYGRSASNSHRSMGTELDLVVSHKLHERVSLQAGYSYMWGHAEFNGLADDDVRFAFFQVEASY